jgi:hypothetical protein
MKMGSMGGEREGERNEEERWRQSEKNGRN